MHRPIPAVLVATSRRFAHASDQLTGEKAGRPRNDQTSTSVLRFMQYRSELRCPATDLDWKRRHPLAQFTDSPESSSALAITGSTVSFSALWQSGGRRAKDARQQRWPFDPRRSGRITGGSTMDGHRTTSAFRRRGRHRQMPKRQPYSWLGPAALTLGVGAALVSGAGVADADDAASSAATPGGSDNGAAKSPRSSSDDGSPRTRGVRAARHDNTWNPSPGAQYLGWAYAPW